MTLIYHENIGSISVGGQEYVADEGGYIDVPEELAESLIKTFGFTRDEIAENPNATIKTRPLVQWKNEDLIAEIKRLELVIPENAKSQGRFARNDLIAIVKEAHKKQADEAGQ